MKGNGYEPLYGKTAIVTGCAQGIGAGICKSLIEAGANVLAVDIQEHKLSELKTSTFFMAGDRFEVHCSDITNEENCKKIVANTVSSFGGIDIIVNCAAPSRNRDYIKSISLSEWNAHQKLIIEAPLLLAGEAREFLSKTGSGAIVNISSVLASSIAQDQASPSYHIAKAGLDQLTKWLAVHLGEYGIRVNAVAPGIVDREGAARISEHPQFGPMIKSITPLGRVGAYRDIGDAVVFLCSEFSSYITGHVLVVDGGLSILEAFGAASKAMVGLDYQTNDLSKK
jgi:3-oxoacyl-[acyl-carrier protein] reductase